MSSSTPENIKRARSYLRLTPERATEIREAVRSHRGTEPTPREAPGPEARAVRQSRPRAPRPTARRKRGRLKRLRELKSGGER